MTLERVSKWLFLASGAYAALCAPAIPLAEHYGLRESPLHISQALAVAACIPSSALYLWTSRGQPFKAVRVLALWGLVLALAWAGFIAYVLATFDLGDD